MRILTRYPLVAALSLAGLLQQQLTAAPASVTTVDEAGRSAHFDAVSRELELGGVLYGYIDIDGDVAKLGDMVSRVAAQAAEINPMAALARQDYAEIFADLGLSDVKAIGLSSVRDGDGFRNRVFVYTPAGRRGLLAITGGNARPFANTRHAPADTDLFFETEIDAPAAYAAVRAIVARVGGEGLVNTLEGEIKKPQPNGLSVYEAIQSVSGRYTVAVKLDPAAPIPLPNGVLLPDVSFFVKADGLAEIFRKLIKENEEIAQVTEDGRTFFELKKAAPGTALQPVLMFEDGAFVVASNRAFARTCLGRTSGGLDAQPEFRAALASVGAEGNGLCYVTPRVFDEVRKVIASVATNEPQAAAAIGFWTEHLPRLSRPLVSVRSNRPDGILTRSYSFRSLKQEVLLGANGPVTIGLLSAMAIPAFQKVRATSQEKAIQNNLRIFSSSAQMHMLETGAKSASYADLVGSEDGKYIRELKPVAGEDYESLVLHEGDTEISVTTVDGRIISLSIE